MFWPRQPLWQDSQAISMSLGNLVWRDSFGAREVGPGKFGPPEVSIFEVRSSEVGQSEVSIFEMRSSEVGPFEMRSPGAASTLNFPENILWL